MSPLLLKEKLILAIKECKTHRQKLLRSSELLEKFFPLNVDNFPRLSEEQIEHIDQAIYRYTKMQDAMGKRLYSALFYLTEAENDTVPFLDILSRLEKQRFILSEEKWQFFRSLRNALAHDYPGQLEKTVATLNLFHQSLPNFLSFYMHTKEAAHSG